MIERGRSVQIERWFQPGTAPVDAIRIGDLPRGHVIGIVTEELRISSQSGKPSRQGSRVDWPRIPTRPASPPSAASAVRAGPEILLEGLQGRLIRMPRSTSPNRSAFSRVSGDARCGTNPFDAVLLFSEGERFEQAHLAGGEGFEPSNGGSKVRCLTTWRPPNASSEQAQGTLARPARPSQAGFR